MGGGVNWLPDCQPLPRVAESLTALRERYPAAIEREWNANNLIAFAEEGLPFDRPTIHREHVFDTEDGVRLGVSKESRDGVVVLHISASVEIGSNVEKRLEKLPIDRMKRAKSFIAIAEKLIAEITGRTDFTLIGASSKGVFHWNAPLEKNS